MRTALRTLFAVFSAVLLASCGGGGGGGGDGGGGGGGNTDPVASTLSFPVQAAHRANILSGGTTTFTISGTCQGTATMTEAPAAASNFEGVAGYTTNDTFNVRLTNCTPSTIATTGLTVYDNSFSPIATMTVGEEYTRAQTPPSALPAQMKVGDNAQYATYVVYSDSALTNRTGTRVFSYIVEADTADTAIVNYVSKDFDTLNRLTSTGQNRYRVNSAGSLTLLSQSIQAGTTQLTLTSNGRIPPSTVRIGGTVTGLQGTGLVLQMNGANDLSIAADGTFNFPGSLGVDSTFVVTVKSQPTAPTQTCSVLNGLGSTLTSAITSIVVNCVSDTYSVSGSVTGLTGSGLVLQLNGANDLAISASGAFSFPGPLTSAQAFSVTVKSQPTTPTQTCVVFDGQGNVSSTPNVHVQCSSNTYTVGGSVTGLTGTGLVLQLNGADDMPIAADGIFRFPTTLTSGASYSVTVKASPLAPQQACTVTNGQGTVTSSLVSNVLVGCALIAAGPPAGFLYVGNGVDKTISTYAINGNTGGLSPVGSLVSFGGFNLSLALDPAGKFFYVTADYLYIFQSDPITGALSQTTGSPIIAFTPSLVGMTSDGRFAYGLTNAPERQIYSVDTSTGMLTPTVNSVSVANVVGTAFSNDGKHAYLSIASQSPTVGAFTVDSATGVLTQIPGALYSVSSTGSYVSSLRVTPDGLFVYCVNYMDAVVLGFSRNTTTGALTKLAGSPYSVPPQGIPQFGGSGPTGLVIHTSGKYVYVGNSTQHGVMIYDRNLTTGVLTLRSVTPVDIGAQPSSMTQHPSGKFLFVLSSRSKSVSSFAIDAATGDLTPVPGSPVTTGVNPTSMVLIP